MLGSVAVVSSLLLAVSIVGTATNYADYPIVNLDNGTNSINNTGSITGTIIVRNSTGEDSAECFNSSCRTLTYVPTNAPSLNYSEVVLFGDQWINQTLTISHVVDLTIKSGGSSTSLIRCSNSTEPGSGLVFTFVLRLKIKFEGCGTRPSTVNIHNHDNLALLITNSSDFEIVQTSFYGSKGRGLTIFDTAGQFIISNCSFVENYEVITTVNRKRVIYTGGGIHIELRGRSHHSNRCDYETSSPKYLIQNCKLEGNRVSGRKIDSTIGEGGGLNVIITGYNNSIVVENCTFVNNSADEGGAINVIHNTENAQGNIFHIVGCIFQVNEASERGGGALQLTLYGTDDHVNTNSITVQDTSFTGNSARWGGAVGFSSSQSESDLHNCLTFKNCTFLQNAAITGSALYLTSKGDRGCIAPTALLHDCKFVSNRVLSSEHIGDDGESHPYIHSGSLYVESMGIELLNYVSFNSNRGSGVVVNAANINVRKMTFVQFANNSATNGGGIVLVGPSVLQLRSGSEVVFDSNHASELGGAVYATFPHQTGFIKPRKCFISFEHDSSTNAVKLNATLKFTNNHARYGRAIFADSVLACMEEFGSNETNFTGDFPTPGMQQYTVATSPVAITFTLPPEIFPGQVINLNPVSIDELNQTIPSSFKVAIDTFGNEIVSNDYLSDDGNLQFNGEPGTNFALTLVTQNKRPIISPTKLGRLETCPLGFVLVNNACVCSADIHDERFIGIPACDYGNFQALLQAGYWVGCTDDNTIVTGVCYFCNYHNKSLLPIPRTCEDFDEFEICANHRKGLLCGECEKGYTQGVILVGNANMEHLEFLCSLQQK